MSKSAERSTTPTRRAKRTTRARPSTTHTEDDVGCWVLTIKLARTSKGANLTPVTAREMACNIIHNIESRLPKQARIYLDWEIDSDLLPPKMMAQIWPQAIAALKAEDANFGTSGEYLTGAEAGRLDERVDFMLAADDCRARCCRQG